MAEVGNDCYFFVNSTCIKVNIVQLTVPMLKLFSRVKEEAAIKRYLNSEVKAYIFLIF